MRFRRIHARVWSQLLDGESASTGKPTDVTPGCPGTRPLVQHFDVAGAGRPNGGGVNRQSRPGRDDGQTATGSDRASRSRSLAARWTATTATDILPSKPKWMTTTVDRTKQLSHVEDFDRQRQVASVSMLAFSVGFSLRQT